MPLAHNILILRLPNDSKPNVDDAPDGRADLSGRLFRRRQGLHLTVVVGVLRMLGYRLVPLTAALEAATGRFAVLTVDDPSQIFMQHLVPTLNRLKVQGSVFVCPETNLIPWAELKDLQRHRWEVGTLGQELTLLTEKSYFEQRRLISMAKATLGRYLGTPPRTFAYPFGAYDATTVSCLREEGFTAALTLQQGLNPADGEAEAFHLRRLPLAGMLLRDLWLVIRSVFSASRAVAAPAIRAANGRESIASRRAGAIS